MATLEWLKLAQENIRSIIEEYDNDLLPPSDFMMLLDMLDELEDIYKRARARFREFFEDMTEGMS